MQFSTYLEGYDKKWSDWQNRSSREFTNLYEGNYRFIVRAKNIYGKVSEEVLMEFSIKPPFERSFTAYMIYVLLSLIVITLIG